MENKKRSISTKTFAILLAVVLIIGCMAGGTIAWLISTPDAVVNTFTYGDINIELFEHGYDADNNALTTTEVSSVNNYKIIPGVNLPKDPTVRVKAGSEACYLFVKVEKTSGTFVEGKVTYAIDTDVWTQLTDKDGKNVDGVFYKSIDTITPADATYNVLKNKTVTVSDTLKKTDINALGNNKTAVLTFTAYAVQKEGFRTPEDAWAEASK